MNNYLISFKIYAFSNLSVVYLFKLEKIRKRLKNENRQKYFFVKYKFRKAIIFLHKESQIFNT